jgi:hypothetical protein
MRDWAEESREREAGFGLGILGAATRLLVRPYRRVKLSSRKVAVVVPLSARPQLLPEETQSMRHLMHYLARYPKYLVAPSGSGVRRDGFETIEFPSKFFGSAAAHNRLLLWPPFYRAFEDFDYILMYHLDSLVLSDELSRWCDAGFDYIGAPWIPCADMPWVKEPRVGNGGFTLMKVDSVLQVLYIRYRQEPESYWSDLLTRNGRHLGALFWVLERLEYLFPRSKVIGRPLMHWRRSENPRGRNNDQFWSYHASRYKPDFKLATVEEGLQFAFEAAPRKCLELNGGRMPFGCHAWARYDRAFWEPYLLAASSHATEGRCTALAVDGAPSKQQGTTPPVSRHARA